MSLCLSCIFRGNPCFFGGIGWKTWRWRSNVVGVGFSNDFGSSIDDLLDPLGGGVQWPWTSNSSGQRYTYTCNPAAWKSKDFLVKMMTSFLQILLQHFAALIRYFGFSKKTEEPRDDLSASKDSERGLWWAIPDPSDHAALSRFHSTLACEQLKLQEREMTLRDKATDQPKSKHPKDI